MAHYEYDEKIIKAKRRFDKKYQLIETGCWQWIGGKDRDGYGVFGFTFNGEFIRSRAHRVSWILENKQDWPDDKKHARHTCNNTSCVNPAHVIPGTAKENMQDKIQSGRHRNRYTGKII